MIIKSRLQDWMALKPKKRDKAAKNAVETFKRHYDIRAYPSGVRLLEIFRLLSEEVAEYRKEPKKHKRQTTLASLKDLNAYLERCNLRHAKTNGRLRLRLERENHKYRCKLHHKKVLCDHEIRGVRHEAKLQVERKDTIIGRLYTEIEALKEKLPKGPVAGSLGRKLEPHDAKVR